MLNRNETHIPITATDKTSRAFASARNNLTGLSSAGAKVTRMLRTIGVGFGVGLTASTALAAKSLLSAAAEFEKAAREVNSLLNLDETGFKELTRDIQEASLAMGVDLIDTTKAAYQAISAGVPRENLLEFLKTASAAAVAGLTSTETAVDVLSTVVNSFGQENISASRAADILFSAVKDGKTTFDQLAASMSVAAPLAAKMGLDFEEVAAAAAVLTQQGVPTAEAMTQIRAVMVAMKKPTAEMADTIERLGFETADALVKEKGFRGALDLLTKSAEKNGISITQIFSRVEALNGTLGLTGRNAEAFGQSLTNAYDSAGDAAAAFAINNDTATRATEKVKVAWQNLGASLQNTKAWGDSIDFLTMKINTLNASISKAPELMIDAEITELEHTISKAMKHLNQMNDGRFNMGDVFQLFPGDATRQQLKYITDLKIALEQLQARKEQLAADNKNKASLISEESVAATEQAAGQISESITKTIAEINTEINQMVAAKTIADLRAELEDTVGAAQAAFESGNVVEYDSNVQKAVATQKKLNAELVKGVMLRDEAIRLLDEMSEEGVPTMDELFDLMDGEHDTLTLDVLNNNELMLHSMKRASDGMADAFVEFAMTGKASMADFASSVLQDMARMLIQMKAINPMLNGLFGEGAEWGGFFGGLFGGGNTPLPAAPTAEVFHKGGVVPRYHFGGIGGLKPDERPAILQIGEEVLTSTDPRHRKNISPNHQPAAPAGVGGNMNVNFTIQAIDTQSGAQVILQQRDAIISVINEAYHKRSRRGITQ